MRQAYKKFVETIVELVGSGVPTEELHELAVEVYRLFGAHEEKFDENNRVSEKK